MNPPLRFGQVQNPPRRFGQVQNLEGGESGGVQLQMQNSEADRETIMN